MHQRQVLAERQRLIRRAAELEHDNDDKIDGLAEAQASAAQALARLDGIAPGSPEDAAAQAIARSQILRAAIEQRIGAAMPDKAVTLYTVTPTYFSNRYFGVRETGLAWTGGTTHLVVVRTVAVDIEDGSMLMSGACARDQTRPFFTFGNLLTVCTESQLETFQALWREHGEVCRPMCLSSIPSSRDAVTQRPHTSRWVIPPYT